MRKITATLCLTLAVLLGITGVNPTFAAGGKDTQQGRSDDTEFQRGLATVRKFNLALKALEKGDFSGAYEAFLPLAKFGFTAAQHNLAFLYDKGRGIERDTSKAIYWYEKAGEQGYVQSQVNLALKYTRGSGIPKDHRKAVYWWEKAAENGFTPAQAVLGGYYMDGTVIRKNLVKAHMWFSIAASSGFAKVTGSLSAVEKQLTSAQIADAQKLARECVRKKYKGC
jgi:uncharacterized protein